MDVEKILSIILGSFGVLSIAASFLNGARKNSLISILTQENTTLVRQKAEALSDNARLTAERDGYKRQYEDAAKLAQGSPQLKILNSKFTALVETNKDILHTLQSDATTLRRNTRQAKQARQQVKRDLEDRK